MVAIEQSVKETHETPAGTISETSTHKITYRARGFPNFLDACYAAWVGSPEIYGGMYRHHMDYSPHEKTEGDRQSWNITIEYNRDGTPETAANPTAAEEFEPELTFDTTGEKQKIFSTEEWEQYNNTSSGTPWAPNLHGAIGVHGKSIEGVEVVVPSLKWSETHRFKSSEINGNFVDKQMKSTGKTNDSPWRIFAKGEVLYLGAQGKRYRRQPADVTFHFIASPNVTNGTYHGISGIDKGGWDYIWPYVESDEDSDNKTLIPKVLAVFVHKVYKDTDFEAIGMKDDAFEVI